MWRSFLKDTHIHTIDLSHNRIEEDGVRALTQNLNGTPVHTVNLLHNHIEAETKKYLKETYFHIKWIF